MEVDEELEEQIKAQVEEWSSDSNACLSIALVRAGGIEEEAFEPEFTYPIFGEEERIFGYQDLDIQLSFAAHNLKPHLQISYSKKFPAQGEVKPTDIHEALRDFLPEVAFSKLEVADALVDQNASAWNPPGEKIHEYSVDSRRFEIWCASLADPAARELLENMQILMPMFIEGGSTLQLEQDWTAQRWKIFLLYAVEGDKAQHETDSTWSPYSFVGYGTSYRIFSFPDRFAALESDLDSSPSLDTFLPPPESTYPDDLPSTKSSGVKNPLELPSRERLSQFLILPPYHRLGHGRHLYRAMYLHLTGPSNIREFTVEDPNEAFDDLRDLSDLLYLRAHNPDFAALRVQTSIPPETLSSTETHLPTHLIVPLPAREKIMRATKLMPRQFDRLVEMHTLSFIPPHHRNKSRVTKREKASNENDKAYYLWRLYVKQRLYLFNRDQLGQVEREERIEKLESALDAVQAAYEEMIERVARREAEEKVEDSGVDAVAGAKGKGKARGKRRVVDDDEDDEVEAEVVNGHGSKKMRVG